MPKKQKLLPFQQWEQEEAEGYTRGEMPPHLKFEKELYKIEQEKKWGSGAVLHLMAVKLGMITGQLQTEKGDLKFDEEMKPALLEKYLKLLKDLAKTLPVTGYYPDQEEFTDKIRQSAAVRKKAIELGFLPNPDEIPTKSYFNDHKAGWVYFWYLYPLINSGKLYNDRTLWKKAIESKFKNNPYRINPYFIERIPVPGKAPEEIRHRLTFNNETTNAQLDKQREDGRLDPVFDPNNLLKKNMMDKKIEVKEKEPAKSAEIPSEIIEDIDWDEPIYPTYASEKRVETPAERSLVLYSGKRVETPAERSLVPYSKKRVETPAERSLVPYSKKRVEQPPAEIRSLVPYTKKRAAKPKAIKQRGTVEEVLADKARTANVIARKQDLSKDILAEHYRELLEKKRKIERQMKALNAVTH
jgi:hypothetical protein